MGITLDAKKLKSLVMYYGRNVETFGHAKINVKFDAECVKSLTVAFTSAGFVVWFVGNTMIVSK
jgi:hypothetical protein